MKKIVKLLFACAIALSSPMSWTAALAQKTVDDYDTLHGNYYPYYYYNFQCDDYNASFHPCLGPNSMEIWGRRIINTDTNLVINRRWCSRGRYISVDEMALYMQPDSATRVIGIAFCDGCFQYRDTVNSSNNIWTDSGVYHITLYDTNMNVIHSVIVNHDTLPTVRYLHWEDHDPNPPFFFQRHHYYSVHEYYFHAAIDLLDNFYVGVRKTDCDQVEFVGQGGGIKALLELPCWRDDSIHVIPLERCRYRLSAQQEGGWLDEECGIGNSTLLWPILEHPGDSCPDVQGLRWSRLGSGTTAFVQWDAGVNHRDWQLSYGPTGTPAGEGTVVDCPPAQCVLPGLAAGQQYDVYVRARCRFARDEWTGWSGPLEVGFGNPGEGINGTASDIAAELTPNPATGRVKVACAEAMRKVEVYDMQGRRCLAQEVQGSETVLDISALAAGRYTVLLHTATTTAARPLIVQ